MAEKQTNLAQLKKALLRNKTEFLTMLVEAFEGIQVGITVTLPAANWASNAQTIQNESLLADSSYWYIIGADASCLSEANTAVVRADDVTVDGQITFRCDTVPTTALTMNIIRLEVDT